METREIGGGSYLEPNEVEMKTVEVKCLFTTYLSVPSDLDFEQTKEYIKNMYDNYDLLEESDEVIIDDII